MYAVVGRASFSLGYGDTTDVIFVLYWSTETWMATRKLKNKNPKKNQVGYFIKEMERIPGIFPVKITSFRFLSQHTQATFYLLDIDKRRYAMQIFSPLVYKSV